MIYTTYEMFLPSDIVGATARGTDGQVTLYMESLFYFTSFYCFTVVLRDIWVIIYFTCLRYTIW